MTTKNGRMDQQVKRSSVQVELTKVDSDVRNPRFVHIRHAKAECCYWPTLGSCHGCPRRGLRTKWTFGKIGWQNPPVQNPPRTGDHSRPGNRVEFDDRHSLQAIDKRLHRLIAMASKKSNFNSNDQPTSDGLQLFPFKLKLIVVNGKVKSLYPRATTIQ